MKGIHIDDPLHIYIRSTLPPDTLPSTGMNEWITGTHTHLLQKKAGLPPGLTPQQQAYPPRYPYGHDTYPYNDHVGVPRYGHDIYYDHPSRSPHMIHQEGMGRYPMNQSGHFTPPEGYHPQDIIAYNSDRSRDGTKAIASPAITSHLHGSGRDSSVILLDSDISSSEILGNNDTSKRGGDGHGTSASPAPPDSKSVPSSPPAQVYSDIVSGVPVFEAIISGTSVLRRKSDNFVNATQILKVAGLTKPRRSAIMQKEILSGSFERIQGGTGKFQGTWVTLDKAKALARRFKVDHKLFELLEKKLDADEQQVPLKVRLSTRKRTAKQVEADTEPEEEQDDEDDASDLHEKGSRSPHSESTGRDEDERSSRAADRDTPMIEHDDDLPYKKQIPFVFGARRLRSRLINLDGARPEAGRESTPSETNVAAPLSPPLTTPNWRNRKERESERAATRSPSPHHNPSPVTTSVRSKKKSQKFFRSSLTPEEHYENTDRIREIAAELCQTLSEARLSHLASISELPHSGEVDRERSAVAKSLLLKIYLGDTPAEIASLWMRGREKTVLGPNPVLGVYCEDGDKGGSSVVREGNEKGDTLVHWCARMARVNTLKSLLIISNEDGSGETNIIPPPADMPYSLDVASRNLNGETPLMVAVQSPHSFLQRNFEDLVRLLAGTLGLVDVYGRTVLHHAVAAWGQDGIDRRDAKRAKIQGNVRIPTSSYTPEQISQYYVKTLLTYITNENEELMHLIESGDVDGDTPLHCACRNGDEDTVNLLTQVGRGVTVPNLRGETPASLMAVRDRRRKPRKGSFDEKGLLDGIWRRVANADSEDDGDESVETLESGQSEDCEKSDYSVEDSLEALLRCARELDGVGDAGVLGQQNPLDSGDGYLETDMEVASAANALLGCHNSILSITVIKSSKPSPSRVPTRLPVQATLAATTPQTPITFESLPLPSTESPKESAPPSTTATHEPNMDTTELRPIQPEALPPSPPQPTPPPSIQPRPEASQPFQRPSLPNISTLLSKLSDQLHFDLLPSDGSKSMSSSNLIGSTVPYGYDRAPNGFVESASYGAATAVEPIGGDGGMSIL
ncbi:transcriptional regulator swi6 [Phlyctochytrium planicorne]|nr:transcriptional regulator swi6 [Phlyctochytrium planicorne]